MNPALPLLVLGHAPGTLAVEVVPRTQLQRLEARFDARFVAPPIEPRTRTFPGYPRALVTEIEGLLDLGRTQTAALAEDDAARSLAAAERLLRAHPELPQAAWLMAEHHHLAAALAERRGEPGASELRRRATALEPERAPAFGEPAAAVGPTEDRPSIQVELRGVFASDAVEWDGSPRAFPARVEPGEHHLRVLREGEPIWAGWVAVSPATPVIVVDAPRPSACSQVELAGTRAGAARPLPPPAVRCPAWAVLRVEHGRARIALCRRASCGSWLVDAPATPPLATGAPARLPTWATLALAGAGAALFATVTLWQTGAFERDEPPSARWVYGGFVSPEPPE